MAVTFRCKEDAPKVSEPIGHLESDVLLQASRRLDWRFLFPNPALHRVAYIGRPEGALHESLRIFCATLSETAADHFDTTELYDVVVLCDPSMEVMRWAAELLRPGGFLYAEAHTRLWAGILHITNGLGLRCAADYITALERIGLVDVQAYWHWPDFESCVEIVPLGDRSAICHALARRGSSAGARLKSAVARWLLRLGLLSRFVSCFSVVGSKSG